MDWKRRIQRAEELAEESPVLPELLHFYCEIARFQGAVAEGPTPANLEALRALSVRSLSDPMHAFFARVLRQAGGMPRLDATTRESACPSCGERPVASVLRLEGGFQLCSMCFREWEFQPSRCPHCGEQEKRRLYRSDEMTHVCVEACETCGVYLKSIDLTRDPRAVPEVDELASVFLDLWAMEHGYTKLQTNLFGI